MQSARINNGPEIEARTFALLTEDTRETYRGHLRCPDLSCSAPAHFRRRSKDGKPDLFYSTSHAPDCTQRSSSEEATLLEGDPVEVAAVWNDATDLVLRFDDNLEHRSPHEVEKVTGAPERGRRHSTQQGERRSSTSSTSLRPLLRRLRDDAGFRSSARSINIGEGVSGPVSSLCIRTTDLEAERGARLVVWGPVFSVRREWIDSAPKSEQRFAVRVPEQLQEDAARRSGLSAWDDPSSSTDRFSFIVAGNLRNKNNGAPYMTAADAQHVAVLREH